MKQALKKVTAGMAAGIAIATVSALPASAARNPAKGRSVAASGCRILASVDLDRSDASILRGFRAAKVQFKKAATYDTQYNDLVRAVQNIEASVQNGNKQQLRAGLGILIDDCNGVGIDLQEAWGGGAVASAPPPAAPPAAPPPPAGPLPPVVNTAPRRDDRNSAFNNDLPTQNEGAPFNFPIPSDFRPIPSSLAGRTYRSLQVETVGSQLALFEQGCQGIGWPVIDRADSRPILVDGQSINGGALVCRSHDGGRPGEPAPWRFEMVIFAQNGASIFNVVFKRG
jgi:hypothetical protein